MRYTVYVYGYKLDDGTFNELGYAYTLEAAQRAVAELADDELVIVTRKVNVKA